MLLNILSAYIALILFYFTLMLLDYLEARGMRNRNKNLKRDWK